MLFPEELLNHIFKFTQPIDAVKYLRNINKSYNIKTKNLLENKHIWKQVCFLSMKENNLPLFKWCLHNTNHNLTDTLIDNILCSRNEKYFIISKQYILIEQLYNGISRNHYNLKHREIFIYFFEQLGILLDKGNPFEMFKIQTKDLLEICSLIEWDPVLLECFKLLLMKWLTSPILYIFDRFLEDRDIIDNYCYENHLIRVTNLLNDVIKN